MTDLYIDTNIIIDAVEGRKNKFGKNIGNPAADLFTQSISCKYHLIISTWTLKELFGLSKIDSTKMFFELAKNKIKKVPYSSEEETQAKEKSAEHYDDALHIIIAEREKADYLVTRNDGHFKAIGTTIPIKKPEDLL